ncbi:aspartate, glycine, lysine and serine-rich protein-like [Vigna radiata var. radiata]|uniref:Aspartate, glycine, lysine and serine-rich protein-like n=1 Tax=Vigna radiata var. radiata TaxID=3916 RepID=A0A1S3VTF3_VIGRR|nr:aspartate, glycine, lysine and serine-rich protein-like [Vigna radiata var. radiata]
MAVLFGKLREHELELNRLSVEEAQGKRKTLAFKTENSKGTSSEKDEESEDEDSDDDDMIHMFRKFNKFMKLKGKEQFKKDRKKKHRSSLKYTCYGYGEKGHVNGDCPNLNKGEEKKSFKKKNVYIAWNDNASSTSCSSDSVEEANLCLTTIVDDTASQVKFSKGKESSMVSCSADGGGEGGGGVGRGGGSGGGVYGGGGSGCGGGGSGDGSAMVLVVVVDDRRGPSPSWIHHLKHA